MKSISSFLENKSVLVTGSTGFLAKILVEKILNVQPNVKRIYLIFRAIDKDSALKRLHSEIIGKDLFRVLKEKWGRGFDSFILEKLVPIPGDISYENLGIEDSNLRNEIWKDIDFIVNSAATTNFNERYDVSLSVNTMGALNVLNFGKKCSKLKMLLHVSTVYVCGEQEGLIPEKALQMGETLKTTSSKLDVEEENKLVADKLQKLKAQSVPEEDITTTLRNFGMERAKLFGWPNTYTFTKAMGEMCLGQLQDHNLPIIIIRPTIISSTYKEPFPGWMEGFRTIDSVIVAYGKGKVTSLFANPTLKVDIIPADMVVNAIIVAMESHANDQFSSIMNIYHVGSSLRHPINFSTLHCFSHRYFTMINPLRNKEGRPIQVRKITIWSNMFTFRIYMAIRFGLPLKLQQWVNIALFRSLQDVYISNAQKFKLVMRLVEIYKPYLMFKGIFDDTNTERLRVKARARLVEADTFNFNPNCIDWEDYIINSHIPGLIKYVVKP